MYGKITLNIILIILLALVQISFIGGLPGWLKNINLAVIAVVFILVMGNLRLALFWAFGVAALLDVYSFLPFGANLITFPLVTVLVNFFLVDFFTNRSLYSVMALSFLALLTHKTVIYVFSFVVYFAERREIAVSFNPAFWLAQLETLAINLSAVFIIFYILTFASKNLKPVFLIRR